MSDLIDRLRRELQQRVDATRAAAEEHELLRRALAALEAAATEASRVVSARVPGQTSRARAPDARSRTGSAAGQASAAEAGRQAPGAPTSTRRSAGSTHARKRAAGASARPAGRRAPRGANREAVLRVVGERPGVTAAELAAVSGVQGGTLYALLRRLIDEGRVQRRELPGGKTGYALAETRTPGEEPQPIAGTPANAPPPDKRNPSRQRDQPRSGAESGPDRASEDTSVPPTQPSATSTGAVDAEEGQA